MSDIETRVRDFIHENFATPDELSADESLLDSGIIDSIGVLTLVTWLEQEFEFIIDDDEVVPENLDGVGNLVGFIQTKRAAAGLAD